MKIIIQNIPVERHHSIGQVKRYYRLFYHIFFIIAIEIPSVDAEVALQIAFKAIHDLVGRNGFVSTFLIFGFHLFIIEMSESSLIITQQATTMRKAIDKVKKLTTFCQVSDFLNTKNGPSTVLVHKLLLNSDVLVSQKNNAGQAGG